MQATPSAVKTSPASPGSTEASRGATVGILSLPETNIFAPKNDGETNRNLRISKCQFFRGYLLVSGSVTKHVGGE